MTPRVGPIPRGTRGKENGGKIKGGSACIMKIVMLSARIVRENTVDQAFPWIYSTTMLWAEHSCLWAEHGCPWLTPADGTLHHGQK